MLANGDLLKFDEVLEKTVDECFNFIAYQKDLNYINNTK
tara:strand:- start:281 stop:397 length:117 start_codon:yes stop_codon:yes gene_type:complete